MKLALGTAQMGMSYGVANSSGQVPIKDACAILNHARLCGLDTIDTAIAYGDSEVVLGQLGVTKWKIVTKLPAVPDNCFEISQWVFDQIELSLNRLGTSCLHAVLLHRPSQLLEDFGQDLYKALQELKLRGITSKIGISVYGKAELEGLFHEFPFDIIQAPFNILDRWLVESDWAKQLHNLGIEVHTRSTFLQGLLLIPPNQRPSKFDRWSDIWREWDRWLAYTGLSPLEACLRYVYNFSEINRIIVGVDTLAQLDQIIEATRGHIECLPDFNILSDTRLINPSTWNQL